MINVSKILHTYIARSDKSYFLLKRSFYIPIVNYNTEISVIIKPIERNL